MTLNSYKFKFSLKFALLNFKLICQVVAQVKTLIANVPGGPGRNSNAFARWQHCHRQSLRQLGLVVIYTGKDEHNTYNLLVARKCSIDCLHQSYHEVSEAVRLLYTTHKHVATTR